MPMPDASIPPPASPVSGAPRLTPGRRTLIRVGFALAAGLDRTLLHYSRVADAPVLDPGLFPWTGELERNWRRIKAEAEWILRHRAAIPPVCAVTPDNDGIALDERWRTFVFWGYGLRCEDNCRRCPETARLLASIPGLQTAFLSILGPGTRIPRHNGVSRAYLTCHLGLRVPEARAHCRIDVGGRVYAWRAGEAFVFDDMYPHEVWNETEEERVVLLIYFERPMRFPGTLLRNVVLHGVRLSPYVRDGRRAVERWARAWPGSAPP